VASICSPSTRMLVFCPLFDLFFPIIPPSHSTIMDLQAIEELLEDDLIEDAILQELLNATHQVSSRSPRNRMRTGTSGHDYIQELINSVNNERIQQVFRMQLGTFNALREWLSNHTQLRPTEKVSVEEKLAIFLCIVTRPASNRDAQERFSHSGETISR
jgi:hypothetical protein